MQWHVKEEYRPLVKGTLYSPIPTRNKPNPLIMYTQLTRILGIINMGGLIYVLKPFKPSVGLHIYYNPRSYQTQSKSAN